MCLRFPTSKNKVEHACEEFKDLSDHPQQVSAVLRPSSSRFDGARLLLSQVSAAARGTHSHHTTLINNSYPPPFGLGIVPTTPMDGSSPSTISRGTSPTSHKPHPAFPCGAELACPSHSRVPRAAGRRQGAFWSYYLFCGPIFSSCFPLACCLQLFFTVLSVASARVACL